MSSLEQSLELRATVPGVPAVPKAFGRLIRALTRSYVIIIFLALWELVPRVGLAEPAFLPPLSEVLATGFTLVKTGELLQHVRASLSRSLIGFSLSISCRCRSAAIGWSKGVARTAQPAARSDAQHCSAGAVAGVHSAASIGETSKIALIFYACSWPILLNTVGGVTSVDPLLIKSARTMGLGPVQLFRKVILPASVPTIFVGIRLAGASSLVVLVAAEMIGAKTGLGYLIIYSQYNFQIPHMYFGILTITVIGVAFNGLLQYIERRFTSWKPAPGE